MSVKTKEGEKNHANQFDYFDWYDPNGVDCTLGVLARFILADNAWAVNAAQSVPDI
ncbi:hypothetical protein [Lactiplantibacillus carotarum]|uniref:hypothetical protein n=1 Tax=Lactiplantibacillus carotarum TaxID=2993456 RepID=UPI00298F215F|nr:hypothetical protein [Lactiplantibacillus carotarum]